MGLGTSIVLIAIGAILDFAVTVTIRGFNVHAIGVILMIVGAVGALLSLAFWSSWGGFDAGSSRTTSDAGSSRTTSSEAPVQPAIGRHERNATN